MPMEESYKDRVKDLVIEARQALRDTYMQETSLLEKSLVTVVSKLIKSIDILNDPTKIFFDLDEYGNQALDEIFGKVPIPNDDEVSKVDRQFAISFPDVVLNESEIWPDGDAPDHPTPDDVIEQMEQTGSPATVAKDWLLIEKLEVKRINNFGRDEVSEYGS